MKLTRIVPLVFVAGFALAEPDGAYTASALVLCLLEQKVDKFCCEKVVSVVNTLVGAVTAEGESSFNRCISVLHASQI